MIEERDVANSSAAGVSASHVLEGVPIVRAGILIPLGYRVLNQSKMVSIIMAWLISQVKTRAVVHSTVVHKGVKPCPQYLHNTLRHRILVEDNLDCAQ